MSLESGRSAVGAGEQRADPGADRFGRRPGRVVAVHRMDAGLPVFTGDPAGLAPRTSSGQDRTVLAPEETAADRSPPAGPVVRAVANRRVRPLIEGSPASQARSAYAA
jgi:hypothetical protein